MAPRRGGGGSSSGSSNSSCPNPFPSTYERVYFASIVLFLVVLLGITIAMFVYRKRTSGTGKKLLSLPYIGAVLFSLIGYACSMIAMLLLACGTTDPYTTINWSIAVNVFVNISQWLLLFVVVYTLNITLRQQLGHVPTILQMALLFVVGLMGVLTCVKIGLTSYLNSMQLKRYSRYRYGSISYRAVQHFNTAYISLYLVSVLAAGALALMSIMSLRSRRGRAGDLIGWVIALFLSMSLWILISTVSRALTLNDVVYSREASAALDYLFNFGQALSFISIICIAKHAAWNTTVADPMSHLDTYAGVGVPQQYGNDGHPNGQAHYYQQVPPTAYNGGAHSIKP